MRTLNEFMHEILQGGETIVVAGRRGHGKTATTVSIGQHAILGEYGHENVEIITNVVFGRVPTGGGMPVEAYPKHVHHEDTLAGTLRTAGEIIREYGSGNCTILWMLDEAQNFMMADENGKKENLALTKYLGNARKFDICNLFMTPTINNLTPRVRCFPTGESKSGYCSAQFVKDKEMGRSVAGGRTDPRSITFIRTEAGQDLMPICIRPTPWIRSIYGDVKPGEFGYDTKSMATFSIGENEHGVPFDLAEFLKTTSKGLSHELPDKMDEYWSAWERQGSGDEEALPGEDYTKIRLREQCTRIDRMRAAGVKWSDIAFYEGEIETTLKSRFKKWTSSDHGDASASTRDDSESHVGAYIYNQKRGEGEGAPASSAEGC